MAYVKQVKHADDKDDLRRVGLCQQETPSLT
jgi:hypothetical protein